MFSAPASAAPSPVARSEITELASLDFDSQAHLLTGHLSVWVVLVGLAILLVGLVYSQIFGRRWGGQLEIEEAEIGIGNGKLKLRPNMTDRQIAYAIWVELNTRKVGLSIDLEHDVISEIYDSWYQFFGITRDLIKGIPVSKVTDKSTAQIIRMSIDVLNEGLRPHLTQWQARFRRWYDRQLADLGSLDQAPQEIQKRYPYYKELTDDLVRVNGKLQQYRLSLKRLVDGK